MDSGIQLDLDGKSGLTADSARCGWSTLVELAGLCSSNTWRAISSRGRSLLIVCCESMMHTSSALEPRRERRYRGLGSDD